MPAEQWTRIFSVPFLDVIAPSMISQAAPAIFEMEDEAELLRERRWYVTPSTFVEGLGPMLNTWVMELRVRNGRDDAAEHGPRYREGGRALSSSQRIEPSPRA